MLLGDYFDEHSKALKSLEKNIDKIHTLVGAVEDCIKREGIVWTAGNGGSASTASHLVCDLAKGVAEKSLSRVKAFCLNDNLALNSAWANDHDYESALERQLEKSASSTDLLIVVSGSGNSRNVINAVKRARVMNIESAALLGFDGGEVRKMADISVVVDSYDMQVVENLHLVLAHWIFKALK